MNRSRKLRACKENGKVRKMNEWKTSKEIMDLVQFEENLLLLIMSVRRSSLDHNLYIVRRMINVI